MRESLLDICGSNDIDRFMKTAIILKQLREINPKKFHELLNIIDEHYKIQQEKNNN
ncbi:TPA: hypothetical protein ACMU4L_003660 [Clostridioides difficile]|uniref:hypothetical protein n=1 Tax=Clostridioides difficile TaxID=1496 RepID=UPI0002F1B758|nr:hypothetical protein [Clostridioides difficile]AXU27234.1 hypothetical protein CDIF102859_01420 [Clostridioides difficile]AXU84479.1 hypothetical protein CDIF29632_03374 [Clostridioides difficile]EKS6778565.1 hypothetical protein [Clostridioides difficile]EQE87803.1 hypothetical protein QCW_0909 [Clostridioides difficile CD69]MBH7593327.1 hypothetical protein [Clostridioides difficile]